MEPHSLQTDPGLESLRARRAELRESMGALEQALAAPAADLKGFWTERVNVALIDPPICRPGAARGSIGLVEIEFLELLSADADVAAQVPTTCHFLDLHRRHLAWLHDRAEIGGLRRRECRGERRSGNQSYFQTAHDSIL